MTSLLLVFWLAAAPGASPLEPAPVGANGAPAAPQAPTPPAAPAVKGPPIPAPPEFPPAKSGSLPAPTNKSDKKGVESAEAADVFGEVPTEKRESGRSGGKKKSSTTASQGRGVPPLPTLSTSALKNELRQSQSGSAEFKPLTERTRLEQLAAEIAQAREALRQETARLEELIRQRGSCDGELRAAAAAASDPKTASDAAARKDAEREQMESVSKAMKGMKPEQAAAVVTRLDHRLASEILRRMRPADAGAVLGFLRPELAAELATEIATRKPSFAAKKGAANP
jgi:flagellar motility protein MotE (MotC chaperone)